MVAITWIFISVIFLLFLDKSKGLMNLPLFEMEFFRNKYYIYLPGKTFESTPVTEYKLSLQGARRLSFDTLLFRENFVNPDDHDIFHPTVHLGHEIS
jgi:hypothetical protein